MGEKALACMFAEEKWRDVFFLLGNSDSKLREAGRSRIQNRMPCSEAERALSFLTVGFLDDGTIFGAHRIVLAHCQVDYFRTLVNGNFQEAVAPGLAVAANGLTPVAIREVSADVFKIALEAAYGIMPQTSLPGFKHAAMLTVFQAASRFGCVALVEHLRKGTETSETKYTMAFLQCRLEFPEFAAHQPTFCSASVLSPIAKYCEKHLDGHDRDKAVDLMEAALLAMPERFLLVSNVLEMLDGVADYARPSLVQALLRQISFVGSNVLSASYRPKTLPLLKRLGARGLFPMGELVTYFAEKDPFVISNYPFKVGRRLDLSAVYVKTESDVFIDAAMAYLAKGEVFLFAVTTKNAERMPLDQLRGKTKKALEDAKVSYLVIYCA